MKKIIKLPLLFLCLCFNLNVTSQTSKIVVVSSPGTISEQISTEERRNIKYLTVEGYIDKRDFQYIAGIPNLETLDMQYATIMPYTGLDNSPAYTIPTRAFSNTNIKSVSLPLTCVAIGKGAFSTCDKLEYVNFLFLPYLASIEEQAFFYCRSLSTAMFFLPPLLVNIGDQAFAGCSGMTLLELGQSINFIGDGAFSNCTSLYKVDLPPMLRHLGVRAFEGCTSLEIVSSDEVPILDEVSFIHKIENHTFSGCKKLRDVNLPYSTKYIGDYAFLNCDSLKHIVFKKNIQSIGSEAFKGCSSLETVEYEKPGLAELKFIGYKAFSGCKKLKKFIYLDTPGMNSAKLTSIGDAAFMGCSALEDFIIPQTVETIGAYAFDGCSSLKGGIVLPPKLETVESNVFDNCQSLTSLIIPENVKSLKSHAFYWCIGLKSITADSPTPIVLTSSSSAFYGVPRNTCTLYVPKGSKNLYKEAAVWKEFMTIEERELSGIGTNTLANEISISQSIVDNGFYIQNLSETSRLKLYDISGTVRLSQLVENGDYISTEKLTTGSYILTIDWQEKTKTFKIIKK